MLFGFRRVMKFFNFRSLLFALSFPSLSFSRSSHPKPNSTQWVLCCFSFKALSVQRLLEILTFVLCHLHYSHIHILISRTVSQWERECGVEKWGDRQRPRGKRREERKKHFKKNPLNPQIMNMLASMLGMLYKVHRKKIHESCFSQSSP